MLELHSIKLTSLLIEYEPRRGARPPNHWILVVNQCPPFACSVRHFLKVELCQRSYIICDGLGPPITTVAITVR